MNIGIVEDEVSFRDYMVSTILTCNPSYKTHVWSSATEFWQGSKDFPLDLLLVDIGLPGMDGIELLRLYHEMGDRRSIVVTSLSSDDIIFNAIRLGTSGYILKTESDTICETIDTVLNGGAFISPSIAVRVLNHFRTQPPMNVDPSPRPDVMPSPTHLPHLPQPTNLSSREKQILEEIVNGLNPKEIASLFHTTEGTVRQQIKSIYKKLEVSSRVELMLRAKQLGFY